MAGEQHGPDGPMIGVGKMAISTPWTGRRTRLLRERATAAVLSSVTDPARGCGAACATDACRRSATAGQRGQSWSVARSPALAIVAGDAIVAPKKRDTGGRVAVTGVRNFV
jgi:hypothetical protein